MRSLVLALAAAIVLAGAASAARAQVVVASPYGTGVYASPSYNPYAGIGVNLGVTQVGAVAYPAYPTYPSYGVYTTPYYGGYPYVSAYRGYGYGYGNPYRGNYYGGYRGYRRW